MHKYIIPLQEQFAKAADEYKSQAMSMYLKDNFPFFGIMAGDRRSLQRVHFKKFGIPKGHNLQEIIWQLWELPEREFQYFGLDLYQKYIKKLNEKDIVFFEKLLISKSWWDTVDMIATWLVGAYFKLYPQKIQEVTSKWMETDNIWLNRSCILFQLKYKKKTDFDLLCSFIERLKDSNEFFIQKAIGWSLREYSKIYPKEVEDYVYGAKLSNLSNREALKVIGRRLNG